MENHGNVIDLRAGCAELGVAVGVGGSLVRYQWAMGGQTYDWLRPATSADVASGAADRLACFPLVPFSNRIRDGRFTFGRRTIRLPLNRPPIPHAIHGQGWQTEWKIVARGSDRLSLEYEHAARDWPFLYRARQDLALSEEELRLTLCIDNRGPESMPVGLGWHPYFPRTPGCRLSARVTGMWATDQEVMPTTLVGADPRLGGCDGLPLATVALDNVFTGWHREATITWPERRMQLTIAAEAPLDFLVVYSPLAQDYVCVEPVSHCTDAFNLASAGRGDTGMATLAPGAQLRTTLRLRPAFLEPDAYA